MREWKGQNKWQKRKSDSSRKRKQKGSSRKRKQKGINKDKVRMANQKKEWLPTERMPTERLSIDGKHILLRLEKGGRKKGTSSQPEQSSPFWCTQPDTSWKRDAGIFWSCHFCTVLNDMQTAQLSATSIPVQRLSATKKARYIMKFINTCSLTNWKRTTTFRITVSVCNFISYHLFLVILVYHMVCEDDWK